jgi:hypothetical protein
MVSNRPPISLILRRLRSAGREGGGPGIRDGTIEVFVEDGLGAAEAEALPLSLDDSDPEEEADPLELPAGDQDPEAVVADLVDEGLAVTDCDPE